MYNMLKNEENGWPGKVPGFGGKDREGVDLGCRFGIWDVKPVGIEMGGGGVMIPRGVVPLGGAPHPWQVPEKKQ